MPAAVFEAGYSDERGLKKFPYQHMCLGITIKSKEGGGENTLVQISSGWRFQFHEGVVEIYKRRPLVSKIKSKKSELMRPKREE